MIGIATSGMVDSLFENGPDVGAAISAGIDEVKETGAAIGRLAESAWKSIFG